MKIAKLAQPLAIAVGGITLCLLAAFRADAQVEVTVNGSAVDIAPPAITQAGRVFVPLRGVFEQLGASVDYANGTIDANGNGRDISLRIGSTEATVNGQPQPIDVAPFIVGASTYVPLRFISEALGDSVNWDDADKIAAIDTGGGPADYYTPGTASYVDTAPPPLPDYEQPDVPAPNEMWQPGYWAWGSAGYYWVPGTWVEPPQPTYDWTPGYWQWRSYGYTWNPGYWAQQVGYYGGVNYGCGYNGDGYDGGRWSGNVFQYNTYITRVDTRSVRNVYVDRSVANDGARDRVSYNGGRGGLSARPTAADVAISHDRHLGMTVVQRQHIAAAEADRRLLATVNHGKPAVLAVARPLSSGKSSAGAVPVRATDRINPLAHVTPVHVAPARPARRAIAAHAAPARTARVAPPPARAAAPVARAAPVGRTVVHVAPPVGRTVAHVAPPVARAAAPALRPVARVPARAPAVYAAPIRRAPAAAAAPPVRAARPPAAARRAAPEQRPPHRE
jgi:hypothetical protein